MRLGTTKATPAPRGVPDVPALATSPPTYLERRTALTAIFILCAAFALTAPFAATPLRRFDLFIPLVETVIVVTDFITAVLLFGQSAITPLRALLVFAGGYLFTALIVIPHMLTYPGLFAPAGLLGAGPQSTGWLYFFWHLGFATALLVYASWKKADRAGTQGSALPAVGRSIAIVVGLVCALAWLATGGQALLPPIFLDATRAAPLNLHIFVANIFIAAFALVLLWIRRQSVLDLWLIVAICALISELMLVGVIGSSRFALGFYAGRIFSLITSTVVLVVLLGETTKLYARLARSNTALQQERDNKLMNLEALAASISHEMKQPLVAIALNGSATRKYLEQVPPNLEEAQSALTDIVDGSHRAGQTLDNIRDLFRTVDRGRGPADVNKIARGALHILQGELSDHGIKTHVELAAELPRVDGHQGQLQEVVLNLIRNAIEAMDMVDPGGRTLRVRTQRHDGDKIAVVVEDAGPGIDPEISGSMFDAFVTTKPQGTGLGLAICRTIVEAHGGQLSAWSPESRRGALFQFTLPIESAAGAAPR